VWSAIIPSVLPAKTSGFARASATVAGSSGQSGFTAAYPASSNALAQRSQLLGSSQSPWMKTAAAFPAALAFSTSALSRSLIGI
jgi:hypothetical protein